jgi:hypothetical protein
LASVIFLAKPYRSGQRSQVSQWLGSLGIVSILVQTVIPGLGMQLSGRAQERKAQHCDHSGREHLHTRPTRDNGIEESQQSHMRTSMCHFSALPTLGRKQAPLAIPMSPRLGHLTNYRERNTIVLVPTQLTPSQRQL